MQDEATAALNAFIAVREIVRRAILTLAAIKDPDQRYRRNQAGWCFSVVRDARDSYGYGAIQEAKFEPSPQDISQMEIVAGWLAWLRREEGEGALRRLIGWTMGVPVWRLGQREKCSERTIKNRIDRSVAAIIRKFAAVDLSVEVIEEPIRPLALVPARSGRPTSPFGLFFTPAEGPHGLATLKKVYIYDIGFVIGSKRWRNGQERAEKFAA